jgi:hypothetical protein
MKMDPISLTRVKGLGARVEQMRCDGANEAVTPRVKDWMMKKSQRKPKPPPPPVSQPERGFERKSHCTSVAAESDGPSRGGKAERERERERAGECVSVCECVCVCVNEQWEREPEGERQAEVGRVTTRSPCAKGGGGVEGLLHAHAHNDW